MKAKDGHGHRNVQEEHDGLVMDTMPLRGRFNYCFDMNI
jgi:hypothetical protein